MITTTFHKFDFTKDIDWTIKFALLKEAKVIKMFAKIDHS